MLKRIAIIAALVASPALAQQAPPAQDPALATYAQLLGEANGRVVGLSAEVAKDKAVIADLQKQIDAAKPKAEPMPTDPPK